MTVRDRVLSWATRPRQSVVWDSHVLRQWGPRLLVVWFIEMNLLYLGPWLVALDAHIYHRAAVAFVEGADPWSAQYGGYYFAAAPPSLLPYLPLAFVPEWLAVLVWMAVGLAAGVYIVHRLRLPWWWILFPPLTESIVVGNAQPIALALLLANRAPFTALATIFKLYALVPAVAKLRHVALTAVALAASWILLPWGSYLEALPAITDRLEQQSLGGYSAYGNPAYVAAVVVALVMLRKHGWQWFAIPALWPATQMHYSLYAMPALTPILAVGFSIPIRALPPLIIVCYACVVFVRDSHQPLAPQFRRALEGVRAVASMIGRWVQAPRHVANEGRLLETNTRPWVPSRRVARWPVYPVALACAVVLNLHAAGAAAPEALVRPLLVVVAITLVVQVVLSAIARDAKRGAFIAMLCLAPLVSWLAFFIVTTGGVVFAGVRWRVTTLPWAGLDRFLNVSGVLILVFATANSALAGGLSPAARGQGPTGLAAANAPDIYLVLLDGYPRADTLREDFGIDNEAFTAAMQREGFEVSPDSRSNYNMTLLTLASVFNMQHVLEQPGVDASAPPPEQYRTAERAVNNGRVFDALRSRGYEIVTIASPADSVTLWSADRLLESGHIRGFEISLLRQPVIRSVLPRIQRAFLRDQHRARIADNFADLEALAAERVDHPRLVFAHILAPHAPLVLGPEGEAGDLFPCYPHRCDFWDSGWRHGGDVVGPALETQLDYVNARVIEAVAAIERASSRGAAVVIFSDHGYRHEPDDRYETTSSIFMARTPGYPDLFPDDATPINIFPRLLNAYLGTSLPLETSESYWVDMGALNTSGLFALELVE